MSCTDVLFVGQIRIDFSLETPPENYGGRSRSWNPGAGSAAQSYTPCINSEKERKWQLCARKRKGLVKATVSRSFHGRCCTQSLYMCIVREVSIVSIYIETLQTFWRFKRRKSRDAGVRRASRLCFWISHTCTNGDLLFQHNIPFQRIK